MKRNLRTYWRLYLRSEASILASNIARMLVELYEKDTEPGMKEKYFELMGILSYVEIYYNLKIKI